MDYSQLLTDKTDTILQNWIEAVSQDRKIESADALPHSAIKITYLTCWRRWQQSFPNIKQAKYGIIIKDQFVITDFFRAEQGYNPRRSSAGSTIYFVK
jgi:hypothetical protein